VLEGNGELELVIVRLTSKPQKTHTLLSGEIKNITCRTSLPLGRGKKVLRGKEIFG